MTPVEVVRAWFDAHASGDLDGARALLAEDADIDMCGSRMRGFDAFMTWYGERRQRQGAAFSYQVDDLLAGEHHAAAVLTLSDGQRSWRQVAVYQVTDARIRGVWAREDEPQ
jgi:ketosteroid isomerase-like protein